MPTTWIVTGDAGRARILQVTGRNQVEEIERFENPKGRMRDRDLLTDPQETGAARHETELFAKEIDRRLDLARIRNRFDRLYLVAAPKFLGLLRQNLSHQTAKMVADPADRDLAWFDAREIERYIRANARGSAPAP